MYLDPENDKPQVKHINLILPLIFISFYIITFTLEFIPMFRRTVCLSEKEVVT